MIEILEDKPIVEQLAERLRRLEAELKETREALFAAECRENCLIDRLREGL